MADVVTDHAYIDDRKSVPLTFHHLDGTTEEVGFAMFNKDGTVDWELHAANEVSEKFKNIIVRSMDFSTSTEYHSAPPLRAKTVSIFVEDAQ